MIKVRAVQKLLLAFYVSGALFACADDDTAELSFYRVTESIRIGDSAGALKEVQSYLKIYPNGAHVQRLQALRLSVLFDEREYAELISISNDIDLESLGDQRESVSYMLVGAYCYSSEYNASVAAADSYFSQWPSGRYTVDVLYMKAVSLARLGYVDEPRAVFRLIIKKPVLNSEYLHRSLYELSLIHFREGKYQLAVKLLEKLRPMLIENELKVTSGLLLAQSYAVLREREQAEGMYLECLQLAIESEFVDKEQELLFYLIDFYCRATTGGAANDSIELGVPYYKEFFKKFPNSRYAAQVAMVAIPALQKVGELEVGVKQLEDVVRQASAKGEEAGLRRAAKELVWKLLALGETSAELHQRWLKSEKGVYGIVVRHALADVYRTGVKQSQVTWGRELRFTALADAMYAELLAEGGDVTMPSYVRADLGWWLLNNSAQAGQAIEQFKLSMSSVINSNVERSKIGLAVALKLSNEGDFSEALSLLNGVISRSSNDVELLESALYQKVEIFNLMENWSPLTEIAREYMIDREFTKNRSRVSYLLAKSYDKRGLTEDAIANYTRIFASYTRNIRVSAPSVDRLTSLTWQRNTPRRADEASDKQIAYQLGHRYLSLIESVEEWQKELVDTATSLKNLERNVDVWERSGEVRTVEELLNDLKKSRR